tara:strand:- start:493 stop:1083 length:591 start_codon:yes stop_codon:yes gene_type:complete
MINFKSLKNNIPLPIRLFLGKALLFFIIWKLIYNVFLFDSKYLDQPLTNHVGNASVQILNSLGTMSGFVAKRENSNYNEGVAEGNVLAIYHNNNRVLYIANVCNGLELMVLYIGFIVCMPSALWRKILYIVIGAVLLDIINILRCVGLIYLREYFHVYFQFAHHYLFNAIVYTATILMWMVYARKIQFKNEPIQIG